MKFAKYLATHKAPEWRSEYIRYDEMKEILYSAQANALSNGFITSDSTSEFYENIDQEFLDQCKRELEKINQFYATKIEESKNRLNVLKQQIDLTFGDENFDFEKSKKQNFEKLLPSEDSPVGVLSNIRSTKIAAHQFWERKRNLLKRTKRDEFQFKRRMKALKLGMSELYFMLVLIKEYRELNYTGFRKILKKHDKVFGTQRGMIWFHENVVDSIFFTSDDLSDLTSTIETIYIEKLEGGNRHEAMRQLRVTREDERASAWVLFRIGLWSGILAAMSVLIGIYTTLVAKARYSPLYFNETNPLKTYPLDLHWISVLTYMYRSLYLIDLELIFISACTFCWKHYGVNYVLIFELDPRDHMSFEHILDIGLQFLTVTHSALLLTMWRIHQASDVPIMEIKNLFLFPFFAHLITVLIFINPFDVQYRKARYWYMRTSIDVIIRPSCRPVLFRHFWIGDQFLSLTTVFGDLVFFGVFFMGFYNWHKGSPISSKAYVDLSTKLSTTYLIIMLVVLLLPHLSRFLQCCRRYYEVRVRLHFWNAMKYLIGMPVVTFAVLKPIVQAGTSPSFWNACFAVSGALDMVIKFIWDVHMDWNLFMLKDERINQDDEVEENGIFRKPLIYGSSLKYISAVLLNGLLRASWTGKFRVGKSILWPGSLSKVWMGTLFSLCELSRRSLWNIFRLECEHVNNCAIQRAIRDISIVPIMRVRKVEERDYVEESAVKNDKKSRQSSTTEQFDNQSRNAGDDVVP